MYITTNKWNNRWEGHTRDNNIGTDLVDEEISRTTKNSLIKVKVQLYKCQQMLLEY